MNVGVIVGRFQTPYLHEGHQKVLYQATEECDKVLVFIGTCIVRSERNPLPLQIVRQMVSAIPNVEIHDIKDQKLNDVWEEDLYNKINELTNEEDTVFYYGSRDSFLSCLKSDVEIVNVEEIPLINATEVRSSIEYIDSEDFRRGYIKAVQDEYEGHFSVADALITDGENILLGVKKSGACLIGGFAGDDEGDSSLEDVAIREAKEECNLELSNPEYLGSFKCRDWRYKESRQPYTSAYVFKVDNFDGAKPGDDIDELMVVSLNEVHRYFSPNSLHLEIINKYKEKCQ